MTGGRRWLADSRLSSLFGELESEGLEYALVRESDSGVTRLLLLLPEGGLQTLDAAARRQGLLRVEGNREPSVVYVSEPKGGQGEGYERAADFGPAPIHLTATSELRYGRRCGWLRSREREARILGRARWIGRVRVVAPADELVDTLLHCIIDLGSFPPPHRDRVQALMAHLRQDPTSAGRAAERVQQELAPALTWSDVLADVVHGRWDALLRRRRNLLLRLLSEAPWRSSLRWISHLAGGAAGRPGGKERPAPFREVAKPSGSRGETTSAQNPVTPVDGVADRLSRKQIRGSGLFLAGRGFSSALKFGSQIIIVRYLTTSDFGAWSYALSAVLVLQGLSTLGLNRALARFLPLHLERGEREEFLGVLLFVFGSILLAGAGVVASFHAFPDWVIRLAGAGAGAERQMEVLAILVLLAPIEALDTFLTGVCAAFTNSRTIFIRRYVLSPGVRTVVALLLVLFQADVRLLAYGYLFSGVVGLIYYGWTVVGELRRHGILGPDAGIRVKLPVRRVLSYTVPVMASDWGGMLMVTTGPLLLGYFQGADAVAQFQVVIPLVTLTQLVAQSFALLFEPAAARVSARDDSGGLGRLYWRSAAWVSILAFPAFAASFTAAEPLTVLLFGERYRAAAPILSLLVAASFLESTLGFSGPTLRVTGRVGWLVKSNMVAVASNLALSLALIPSMGALGAGIATAASSAVYVILKQVGVRVAAGVPAFDPRFAEPYLAIAFASGALLAVRVSLSGNPYVLWAAVALATVAVLLRGRASLSIGQTFPELARVPVLRAFVG